MHIYMLFNKSKIYIKTLKTPYMFQSRDHPHGAYIVHSFWTAYNSHNTHDMLLQYQVNITKYITECF